MRGLDVAIPSSGVSRLATPEHSLMTIERMLSTIEARGQTLLHMSNTNLIRYDQKGLVAAVKASTTPLLVAMLVEAREFDKQYAPPGKSSLNT
jgi:oligoribonuclease (3'-5' exoribonuclease)